jgi:membrane protease YdiL (CAAX protease family)
MSYVSDSSDRETGAFLAFGRALLWCAGIAIGGMGVWGGLLMAGQSNARLLPYVVPAMAAFLALGAGLLKWSGGARSIGVRLNAVSVRSFVTALIAGWSTMLCGFLLYAAHRSFAHLGSEVAIQFPHVPFGQLMPGLIMAGVVAGVIEEIAFRGFLQGTLERYAGVVPAIFVSGLLWAAFHLNHGYFAEEPLLWPAIFLGVSAILGTVAYRTNSVVPGMAVHAGFDAAYFLVAGILAPASTPIAFVQSMLSPTAMLALAGVCALIALNGWVAFMRATRT